MVIVRHIVSKCGVHPGDIVQFAVHGELVQFGVEAGTEGVEVVVSCNDV